VNELAMNFASQRVDDGYLKVLIVAEAVVAKSTLECAIASTLLSNSIPMRSRIGTPSFISKKNVCIAITSRGSVGRLLESESWKRGDYWKGLAEAPRLVFERLISVVSVKWRHLRQKSLHQ